VTIRHVAAAAGVSVATVSRVLNGSGSVTSATRNSVQQAVTRLAYVPDGAARSLSTRSTQCIGVLLPDLYGEFFSELIRGIDRAARARALHMLLSCSHGDAAEAKAALAAMRGRVDGLLVMSSHVDSAALASSMRQSLPAVLMNTHIEAAQYSTINIDNYGGAAAMVRHLVGRGHRRIAHIAGPESNVDAKGRLAGYVHALSELLPGVAPQVLRLRNGRTERVTVELGLQDAAAETVEVRSGLTVGDTLLAGAAQGITPGTVVKVGEVVDRAGQATAQQPTAKQ